MSRPLTTWPHFQHCILLLEGSGPVWGGWDRGTRITRDDAGASQLRDQRQEAGETKKHGDSDHAEYGRTDGGREGGSEGGFGLLGVNASATARVISRR